jgi:hypothetical protein
MILHIAELYRLFDAEVMAQNLPAALAHGRILVRFYEAQSQEAQVDFNTLAGVVLADLNLASTFLQRPLFDYREWIPRVLRPLFLATESQLPQLQTIDIGIFDPTIQDETLLSILKERRQSDSIRKLMFTGSNETLPPTLTLWLIVRALLHLGSLINLYLDYEIILQSPLASSQETRVQAYLSLAVVYYLRLLRFNKVLYGVRLYERGLNMDAVLRRMITKETMCFDFNSSKYENARLWAFYVGAVAEQMPLRDLVEPTTAWFNVNLAAQARKMQLLSWQTIQHVLERFLYNDDMQPHGSQWFNKTLGASFGGLGVENLMIIA